MNPATSTYTIGLDLGDRRHLACILSSDAQIVEELPVTNTAEALTPFSVRFSQATIAATVSAVTAPPHP